MRFTLAAARHLIGIIPPPPRVPPEACHITTPLIATAWRQLLLGHPHRDLVHFLLSGLSHGFRLGFSTPGSTLKPARRNMQLALLHPEVVDKYLLAEMAEHRVMGPYPKSAIPGHMSADLGSSQKGTRPTSGG